MPHNIVTETCPAPNCNLTQPDVEQLVDEMTQYLDLFAPAFQRPEQLERSKIYLRGLLGGAQRKNTEPMALGLAENVRSLQHFIGQSTCKAEPVRAIHQRLVVKSLGETDGVALIDESGRVKQGEGGRWGWRPSTVARSAKWPTVRWGSTWAMPAAPATA